MVSKGIWLIVAQAAIVGNLLMLSERGYVWGRNYRAFGSKHAPGLLPLAGVLGLGNVVALYFYLLHPVTHAWISTAAQIAQMAMMGRRVLEFGAIGFLSWISLD